MFSVIPCLGQWHVSYISKLKLFVLIFYYIQSSRKGELEG